MVGSNPSSRSRRTGSSEHGAQHACSSSGVTGARLPRHLQRHRHSHDGGILITAAYEQRVLEIETEAVRHAQQDYPNLTNADIYRIRQHARTTMSEIKLESLDVIREFDIMIIRATAPSAKDATQENGQLLAVGHFDGTQVEMAMYEDVKHALHNEE